MNDLFKQQLQEREMTLLKDNRRIILKWATGCGKSKMAIDLINYTVMNALVRVKPVKILFVVAERAHIKNWQAEFDKWHLRIDRVATDVICYKSLKKYKDTAYDIIVFDECHHALAPKTYSYLEEMGQYNYAIHQVIMLSATLPRAKQDMLEDVFGTFTASTVTLNDAIKSDILPDPKVYVVDMYLDNRIINQSIKVNGADDNATIVKWEDRRKFFFKKIPYIIRCTEKERYQYYTDIMEYWKERYKFSKNQYQHNLWVNTGSQRKRFLGELKTEVVRNLLKYVYNKKRFVCFCASVAQAENLNAKNTISAKKSTKKTQEIIDAFNNKKTDNIFAVGMINEGMNLTDIQLGIITQLDGKERLFVQKAGRAMRAEDPVIVIFYYKDTQDEIYLNNALLTIDSKYVQHISINQLNNIKL